MSLVLDDNGLVAIPIAGNREMRIVDITLDTDYATPGYAITAANVGLGTIEHVITPGPISGYVPEWVPSTGKLQVRYGNNDAADGPLIEVPNGENGIDTLVGRFVFIGTRA